MYGKYGDLWEMPAGKRSHKYGKSPFYSWETMENLYFYGQYWEIHGKYMGILVIHGKYLLVDVHIAMENHKFIAGENSLFRLCHFQ